MQEASRDGLKCLVADTRTIERPTTSHTQRKSPSWVTTAVSFMLGLRCSFWCVLVTYNNTGSAQYHEHLTK